jgi:hypothetical protein
LEISFLVKLVNLELYLVWMGKMESEVMKDDSLNFLYMFIFKMGACEKKNQEW